MSVGGAALLVVGLVIGVIAGPSLQALAAGKQAAKQSAHVTAAKGDYCALYEQTLESDLNVSQSQLESANKDALTKVINQLYTDGRITATQKTKAMQALNEYATNPCAALKQIEAQHAKGAGSGQGDGSAAIATARASLLAAVAKPLGLTPTALQSDLASGKTIAQLTASQHAQKSAVDAAYLGAVQSLTARAVSAGVMSQAQSDMAYSYIQQLVSQGHYPLLDKTGAQVPGLSNASQ